eukprot:533881-Amphidinium_carterae.1
MANWHVPHTRNQTRFPAHACHLWHGLPDRLSESLVISFGGSLAFATSAHVLFSLLLMSRLRHRPKRLRGEWPLSLMLSKQCMRRLALPNPSSLDTHAEARHVDIEVNVNLVLEVLVEVDVRLVEVHVNTIGGVEVF